MKSASQTVAALTLTACSVMYSLPSVMAFTSNTAGRSFATRSGSVSSFISKQQQQQQQQQQQLITSPYIRRHTLTFSPASSTGLFSLFGDLQKHFLSGSAYAQQIDYSSLEHPGPELAQYAQDNKVPSVSHSTQEVPTLQLATFAGGCYWGLELAFQRLEGVVYTAVGYTQGLEQFPTYDQVCAGNTGHTEAVIVYYDPAKIKYEQLLECFFDRVDPTTKNGQGRDYGRQYRTGVYFGTQEQEQVARILFAKQQVKYSKTIIATECKAAMPFWPAEAYHQQYLAKGGRSGQRQSASKGATEEIRCYG
jgi:peptide-methionine (S)-S-oxide reductase